MMATSSAPVTDWSTLEAVHASPPEQMLSHMGAALRAGTARYFLGAGASFPSGLPGFLDLLKLCAGGLPFSLHPTDDLPLMAQFVVSRDGGNRGPLVGRLKDALTPLHWIENPYHRAIARTSLGTVWTSNFDTTIEEWPYPQTVAAKSSDADLMHRTKPSSIELIKIHGCIARSRPSELVITREDYEDFHLTRRGLARRLSGELLSNSFLFIGYQYGDPNIANIVIEARRIAEKATACHFIVLERRKAPDEHIRQLIWVKDLARMGIKTVLVDAWNTLASWLDELALASRGHSVFVTGTHKSEVSFAAAIGTCLADNAQTMMIDGQSTGVGRAALNAFGQRVLELRQDLRARVKHFVNPYALNARFSDDPSLLDVFKQCRMPLLRATQVVVALDGGMGTRAEIEAARAMGCFVIPVPQAAGDLGAQLIHDNEACKAIPEWYVKSARAGLVTPDEVAKCAGELFK